MAKLSGDHPPYRCPAIFVKNQEDVMEKEKKGQGKGQTAKETGPKLQPNGGVVDEAPESKFWYMGF